MNQTGSFAELLDQAATEPATARRRQVPTTVQLRMPGETSADRVIRPQLRPFGRERQEGLRRQLRRVSPTLRTKLYVTSALGAMFVVLVAMSAVRGDLLARPAASAAIVVAAMLGVVVHIAGDQWRVPQRTRTRTSSGAAAVLVVWAVGSVVSLDVAGMPVTAFSDTAEVHAVAVDLEQTLAELKGFDELLALPDPQARVRFRELDNASNDAAALAVAWERRRAALPTDTLNSSVDQAVAAAHWTSEALTMRVALIASPDARLQRDMEIARATAIDAAIDAARGTQDVAVLYGLDMDPEVVE